jgi:probable HAF family extracellular repeat protein
MAFCKKSAKDDQRGFHKRQPCRGQSFRPEMEVLESRCLLSDYTITDLGTLGGTLSQAHAINSSGQIAGMSTIASGDQRGLLYQSGATHALGTLGGTFSMALGINNSGQVVGVASKSGDAATHAFLYSNGNTIDLGTLGGTNSQATAISDAGQIVGWSNTSGNLYTHAFVYSGGKMGDLGTLGGANSQANALNDKGQITGAAFDTSDNFEAFLFSGGKMIRLGSLGGTYSEGFGINLSGQVVGQSTTSGDTAKHAFLYSGVMTDLGTLGGPNSQALAINDSGTIVGQADLNAFQTDAFIYSAGRMTDLNRLLPAGSGWLLWSATGINNAGQIVGYGINPQGYEHAYLLTPSTTAAGSLQFSSAHFSARESHGQAVITVVRSGSASGTAMVQYATSDGTARAGMAYQSTSGTLTFAAGQTSKTFTVTLLKNGQGEGNEMVTLTLSNPSSGTTLGTPRSATLTIQDTDGTQAERFVAQVYWDLLDRPVDAGGLAFWTNQVNSGMTRTQVVADIEGSLEYCRDLVQSLYNRYLDRASDPAGLQAFVGLLQSGGTVEQVESMIAGSDEYFARRGGGTVDGFLGALYRDALNRAVDDTGRVLFERDLVQGVSRRQVAEAIFTSDEYRQDMVGSFYLQYLHRPGDKAGLDAFVNALRQGADDDEVLAALVGSTEYYSQVQ